MGIASGGPRPALRQHYARGGPPVCSFGTDLSPYGFSAVLASKASPKILAIRDPWRPRLTVPYQSFGRHAVIIGSSGSGKTNLRISLKALPRSAEHSSLAERAPARAPWATPGTRRSRVRGGGSGPATSRSSPRPSRSTSSSCRRRSSNDGHGHQNEAAFYILEGRGYEIHDDKRYDWEKGDLVFVHTDSVHRHYNPYDERAAAWS